MNKLCRLLLIIIVLIPYNGHAQDHIKSFNKWHTILHFREDILSDLKRGNLSSCLERIEINKPMIDNYSLLTFNEYWTLNLLCKNPIILTDFYKQKSLRQFYRMIDDSLSTVLYSLAKENENELKETIDELYKNKAEHTINELFLDMLISNSKDSISNFNKKRDKIAKENLKNEIEYPDSIYDLIQYQEIKNKLRASFSIEFKKYSEKMFIGENSDRLTFDYTKLIKRNYGLSFSLSGPRYFGAILMGYSFDLNLIESYDRKFKVSRGYKYYLDEYSDTSNFKVTPGLSLSIGILLVNNQMLNASLSGFASGFSYNKDNGYGSAGISLVSNIYLPKYHQHSNINGRSYFKKAYKVSLNVDLINSTANIGIGVSLNRITQLHFLNTNYIMDKKY